ncbi:hypothetical protein Val02_82130 [Virgisporangium aliadipatigenens]|uniref:Uncharacterized protein n=1 Tax=Virgisporangium aliadipatigenens TaxID=741659 RepID=A0A8J4DWQ0_9ACTN|nr:hypothetical protein [Virgisporangium aliadipatigenens]GIJ51327.1 hypothetical protein Val02_82130 [Virgisporangium aliadipatigenens]
MSDTSLVYDILARDRATPTMHKVAGEVRNTARSSAASTLAMGAAFASASAWAIALGAAVRPAVGAIALVPAVAFAAVGAVSALALASSGLGAAWKASTAAVAGGGAAAAGEAKRLAAAQREVRQATQALEDAQRKHARTQAELNASYAEAAERLSDLSREVAGARLDEEAAVASVAEAERDLTNARAKGNVGDITKADLALRRSKQTLEEVRDRYEDLTAENAKAQAAGVAGSKEVATAQERHAEATRDLQDATERLALAQADLASDSTAAGGGINKAAEAMAKLAPSARAVIYTLLGLRTEWRAVKREVQEETWKNVAGDISALSTVYLPVMRRELVGVGAGWNTTIRSMLGMAASKPVVADVAQLLRNTGTATGIFGQAVSRVLAGLISMGAAGSDFLPRMAQAALQLAERFERWVAAARESGKLAGWISTGLTTLRQLWSILGNISGIFGAVFRAGQVDGLLGDLDRLTARWDRWMNSEEGQAKLRTGLEIMRGILGSLVTVISGVASSGVSMDTVMGAAGNTATVLNGVMGFLADNIDTIVALLPILIPLWLAERMGVGASTIVKLIAARTMAQHTLALRANAAALNANTAAMRGNTVSTAVDTTATNTGALARTRSIVSLVAHRAAALASAAASRVATAAQWLWNAAMTANPIGLIIFAIVALVAGIALLWNNSEAFRAFWIGAWEMIKGAALAVWNWVASNWPLILAVLTGPIGLAVLYISRHWGDIKAGASSAWQWVVDKWNGLVGFVTGLPGRMRAAASGLWDGIKAAFQSAVNWILYRWNSLSFRIPGVSVPGLGQIWGGTTLSVPRIPYLDIGGDITRDGLAVVHAGERVMPAAQVDRLPAGGGGGATQVVLEIRGSGWLAEAIRKEINSGDLRLRVVNGAVLT